VQAVSGAQAMVSLAQQAIQGIRNVITSPGGHQLPNLSGGEYFFSEEWKGYAATTTASQTAAERMAEKVVAIALRETMRSHADAAARRRLVQWVLAGNMTPAQAATVLAENSSASQQLEELKRLIVLSIPGSGSRTYYRIPAELFSIDPIEGSEEGRKFWLDHSSLKSMQIADRFLALVNEVTPGMGPEYYRSNILPAGRIARNYFIRIVPHRHHVSVYFYIPHSREITSLIYDSGIGAPGEKHGGEYHIILTSKMDLTTHRDLLLCLIREAPPSVWGRAPAK